MKRTMRVSGIGFACMALALPVAALDLLDLVGDERKVSDVEGTFEGTLSNGDGFGGALVALGDLDGDGVLDLAVGAPGAAGGGAVWILFLNADGTVRDEVEISAGVGGFGGALEADDHFGAALAPLGDLGGDGTLELAVGAPHDDDGCNKCGAVWILSLAADGTVVGEQAISQTSGGFGGDLDNVDLFGSAAANVGDLDGDGRDELAVGAPGDDDGGSKRGAVWILFLGADGTVSSEQKISQTAGSFGGELDNADAFGSALAGLGNLDGLGASDLAVGAPDDEGSDNKGGAVWVLFLNADGTVAGHQKIDSANGGFSGELGNVDLFGGALATLQDGDSDGLAELAVGATGDDDGGSNLGAVWLLFLDATGSVKAHRKVSATEGGFGGVLDTGDGFGHALAPVGDLDGDGSAEIAVGAPGDDDGGSGRGASWTVFFQAAVEASNPGSGVNPNLLVPGPTPPKLGKVWDPVMVLVAEGEGFLGDPLVDFLGVSTRKLDVTFFGATENELLISLLPGELLLCLFSLPGVNYAIPIPADPDLVGLELFSQGFRINTFTTAVQFTNGLDIVLGF